MITQLVRRRGCPHNHMLTCTTYHRYLLKRSSPQTHWKLSQTLSPRNQIFSRFSQNQIMSDEAFPNAERLFQQAFSATDPAPLLLQLLKEYPTYPAVRDLVVYYTE